MSDRGGRGGRFRGGGRGHHNRGNRDSQSAKPQSKKVSRHEGVELLTGGANSNVITWKKQVADLILEKYGDLGKFLDSGHYYEPPAIEWDPQEYSPEADPLGMKKEALKFKVQHRLKLVEDMARSRTACFATIRSLLSTETELAVRDSESNISA